MLERSEVRPSPATSEAVARAIPAAAYGTLGASLTVTSPGLFVGRGPKNSWGITPVIQVRVADGPHGGVVDVTIGADVEPLYLAIAIAASLFVFPLGLALPLLAFADFDAKRKAATNAFWGALPAALGAGAGVAGAVGPATTPGPYGGSPPQNPYVGR